VTFQVENMLVDAEFADQPAFDEVRPAAAAPGPRVHRPRAAAGRARRVRRVLTARSGNQVSALLASVEARACALAAAWPGGPDSANGASEGAGERGTAAMVEWLGDGLAECVHWRRGPRSRTRSLDPKPGPEA
jgi:hypothetical protein